MTTETAPQANNPVDTATPATTEPTASPAPAEQAPNAQANPAVEGANTEATDNAAATGSDAPTAYTDFTIPEGAHTDPELMQEFTAAALQAGLKQEQAQHLIDMGAKMAQRINDSHQNAMAQQRSDWESTSKADPEFGGEKLNENLATASKAIEAFATPELKQLFDSSGLGNHPEVIRVFYRVGKAISDDKFVGGGLGGDSAPKSIAQQLFPNMNP
jgi:hypothetical protein